MAAGPGRFARARRETRLLAGRQNWFRCLRFADGTTYLRWSGLSEFLISANGRRIYYYRCPRASRESLGVYLLGQVLSFSLLSMGIESLHGTVVVVDSGAVAFVGDCGYGKSTLGAAMLARGFPILTDDLIALRQTAGQCEVQPGVPRIKLFPRVARRVFPRPGRGTRMNRGTRKLVLPLDEPDTASQPVPLRAIYVLSPPRRRKAPRTRLRVQPLAGRDAFLEVVRAAFNLLVQRGERLAGQFRFATDLAASVPVRRLTYPRTLSRLPSVCDAVLKDFRGLAVQGTATAQ